jgi:uncharacterized membrane protein YkoI
MKTITGITLLAAALSLGATRPLAAQKKAADTAHAARAPKGQAAKESDEKKLQAEAKISEADAQKTALAAVPGGKVEKHELEREDGKLIYSYDIKVAGKSGVEEVHVDAITGKVIKHEHEAPKTEAAEKKAEAAKKKP